MGSVVLSCDGTDPIHTPDWNNVVGNKTLNDGGFVGDLLTLARLHLEDAKDKGELREMDAGIAYSSAITDSMKNAITFELQWGKSEVETCFLKAQADKLRCDCENDTRMTDSKISLNEAQIIKLECDCLNDTNMTNSKIAVDSQQIIKLECDCTNDTRMTDSKINLNDAQIVKFECDCLNDTKMTNSRVELNSQQIEKLICDCTNDTNMTDSKLSLNAAQENKLACDCCNQSKISSSQSELYKRQEKGFDDNANQKLYDTQMNAWAMVFGDSNLEEVQPTMQDKYVADTYNRLAGRLASAAGENAQVVPENNAPAPAPAQVP